MAFDIGEALRERVRLISLIGSTEMRVILSMAPEESADWAYLIGPQTPTSTWIQLTATRASDPSRQGPQGSRDLPYIP